MAEVRPNFSNVSALVVDRDQYSLTLTRQMLRGFGVRTQYQARSGEEAQALLVKMPIDLCLIEADLTDMTGYDLVRWMRRRQEQEIRFAPVLILSGYTQLHSVAASRDCGANCVVRKPFSPKTLLNHVLWSAGSKRPYLESPAYTGPDRRFKEPPEDTPGRRATDDAEPDADEAPDSGMTDTERASA